jgi:hypothetical protein
MATRNNNNNSTALLSQSSAVNLMNTGDDDDLGANANNNVDVKGATTGTGNTSTGSVGTVGTFVMAAYGAGMMEGASLAQWQQQQQQHYQQQQQQPDVKSNANTAKADTTEATMSTAAANDTTHTQEKEAAGHQQQHDQEQQQQQTPPSQGDNIVMTSTSPSSSTISTSSSTAEATVTSTVAGHVPRLTAVGVATQSLVYGAAALPLSLVGASPGPAFWDTSHPAFMFQSASSASSLSASPSFADAKIHNINQETAPSTLLMEDDTDTTTKDYDNHKITTTTPILIIADSIDASTSTATTTTVLPTTTLTNKRRGATRRARRQPDTLKSATAEKAQMMASVNHEQAQALLLLNNKDPAPAPQQQQHQQQQQQSLRKRRGRSLKEVTTEALIQQKKEQEQQAREEEEEKRLAAAETAAITAATVKTPAPAIRQGRNRRELNQKFISDIHSHSQAAEEEQQEEVVQFQANDNENASTTTTNILPVIAGNNNTITPSPIGTANKVLSVAAEETILLNPAVSDAGATVPTSPVGVVGGHHLSSYYIHLGPHYFSNTSAHAHTFAPYAYDRPSPIITAARTTGTATSMNATTLAPSPPCSASPLLVRAELLRRGRLGLVAMGVVAGYMAYHNNNNNTNSDNNNTNSNASTEQHNGSSPRQGSNNNNNNAKEALQQWSSQQGYGNGGVALRIVPSSSPSPLSLLSLSSSPKTQMPTLLVQAASLMDQQQQNNNANATQSQTSTPSQARHKNNAVLYSWNMGSTSKDWKELPIRSNWLVNVKERDSDNQNKSRQHNNVMRLLLCEANVASPFLMQSILRRQRGTATDGISSSRSRWWPLFSSRRTMTTPDNTKNDIMANLQGNAAPTSAHADNSLLSSLSWTQLQLTTLAIQTAAQHQQHLGRLLDNDNDFELGQVVICDNDNHNHNTTNHRNMTMTNTTMTNMTTNMTTSTSTTLIDNVTLAEQALRELWQVHAMDQHIGTCPARIDSDEQVQHQMKSLLSMGGSKTSDEKTSSVGRRNIRALVELLAKWTIQLVPRAIQDMELVGHHVRTTLLHQQQHHEQEQKANNTSTQVLRVRLISDCAEAASWVQAICDSLETGTTNCPTELVWQPHDHAHNDHDNDNFDVTLVFGSSDETTFVSTAALLASASTNTNNTQQQQHLIVALWNREKSARAFQGVIPTPGRRQGIITNNDNDSDKDDESRRRRGGEEIIMDTSPTANVDGHVPLPVVQLQHVCMDRLQENAFRDMRRRMVLLDSDDDDDRTDRSLKR